MALDWQIFQDSVDTRIADLQAAPRPMAEVLDDLILTPGSGVLLVIQIIKRVYGLSLREAKMAVEGRCWQLQQEGKKVKPDVR